MLVSHKINGASSILIIRVNVEWNNDDIIIDSNFDDGEFQNFQVTVHVMTSGQMWNMIRRPAEAGRDAHGVRYIQGGRGGQYIFESYIVMAVNMAVAVGFILMNEVPSVKKGKIKKGKEGFNAQFQ